MLRSEEAILKRLEELKSNYELLQVRIFDTDKRIPLVEKYIAEVPLRIRRGELYEAVFSLTRLATLLGEFRIEYRTCDEMERQSPLAQRIKKLEEENAEMRNLMQRRGPQAL